MEIKINLNGVEVPATVDDIVMGEAVTKYVNDFLSEAAVEIANAWLIQKDTYELTKQEREKFLRMFMNTNISEVEDWRDMIVNGRIKTEAEMLADVIKSDRVQYYEYTVEFTGHYRFVVMATSEEAAEDYMNKHSYMAVDGCEPETTEYGPAVFVQCSGDVTSCTGYVLDAMEDDNGN